MKVAGEKKYYKRLAWSESYHGSGSTRWPREIGTKKTCSKYLLSRMVFISFEKTGLVEE